MPEEIIRRKKGRPKGSGRAPEKELNPDKRFVVYYIYCMMSGDVKYIGYHNGNWVASRLRGKTKAWTDGHEWGIAEIVRTWHPRQQKNRYLAAANRLGFKMFNQ